MTSSSQRNRVSYGTSFISVDTIENSSKTVPEQITLLNLELKRLQDQIDILCIDEASLSRRFNALSPVYSLPPEILARIFRLYTHACPTEIECGRDYHEASNKNRYGYLYSPLKLCAVSSQWRSVAYSIPQLWTTFHMELCHCLDSNLSDAKIAFLRYYFDHAGDLPLSLTFDMGGIRPLFDWCYDYDKKALNIKRTLDFSLLDHGMRLKTLKLIGLAQGFWLTEFAQHTIFPQLRSLTISDTLIRNTITDNGDLILPALPALEHLCLHSLILSGHLYISPGFHAITRIHISNVQQGDALVLLLSCRETLVEFLYHLPQFHNIEYPDDLPFTLPRLEAFFWPFSQLEGNLSPWDTFILRNLDVPSLRNFCLGSINLEHDLLSPNLFNRITFTLAELYLGFGFPVWKGLPGMFDAHRCIFGSMRLTDGDLITAFEALAEETCLPSLTVLTLTCAAVLYMRWRMTDEIQSAFITMLEKRAKISNGFVLELPKSLNRNIIDESWKVELKERMQRLVDSGLVEVKDIEVPIDHDHYCVRYNVFWSLVFGI